MSSTHLLTAPSGRCRKLACSYEHCRNDPQRSAWEHAKLNGVVFRATGNTPDWSLEIILVGTPCRDSSTSETREITVHVSIDDRKLQGCGGALH